MQYEHTRPRERTTETQSEHPYEVIFAAFQERREQSLNGKIVIKARDLPWQQSRQGKSKYYIHTRDREAAVRDWMFFAKEIHTESGAHTHQGGLVIYILEGRGYSVYDGVRFDWKPGDLMILPLKPGGIEHQHFNLLDDQPSMWVAFIYVPFQHATGSVMTQVKEQSNWRDVADSEGDDAGPAEAGDR
jgi:quercetin dioxygenase-like cupin family protein